MTIGCVGVPLFFSLRPCTLDVVSFGSPRDSASLSGRSGTLAVFRVSNFSVRKVFFYCRSCALLVFCRQCSSNEVYSMLRCQETNPWGFLALPTTRSFEVKQRFSCLSSPGIQNAFSLFFCEFFALYRSELGSRFFPTSIFCLQYCFQAVNCFMCSVYMYSISFSISMSVDYIASIGSVNVLLQIQIQIDVICLFSFITSPSYLTCGERNVTIQIRISLFAWPHVITGVFSFVVWAFQLFICICSVSLAYFMFTDLADCRVLRSLRFTRGLRQGSQHLVVCFRLLKIFNVSPTTLSLVVRHVQDGILGR